MKKVEKKQKKSVEQKWLTKMLQLGKKKKEVAENNNNSAATKVVVEAEKSLDSLEGKKKPLNKIK